MGCPSLEKPGSSGRTSPAGFSAFALLDGPGLTQLRVQGLGVRVWGLGLGFRAEGG